MPSLAEMQANFIATINDGPAALDPSLFAGPTDRVILGLKAHANTISHARLVALESTFPLCRKAISENEFNRISRAYFETAAARALDSNAIGAHFPEFLDASGVDASAVDLAKIELLWFASYDAAEAEHLALADLAGLDEADLLDLAIALHPAAHIQRLAAPLSAALPELQEHSDSHAILITRPEAMPVLTPLRKLAADIFARAKKNATISNLLELSLEQSPEDDALTPVITLIQAGALVQIRGDKM